MIDKCIEREQQKKCTIQSKYRQFYHFVYPYSPVFNVYYPDFFDVSIPDTVFSIENIIFV